MIHVTISALFININNKQTLKSRYSVYHGTTKIHTATITRLTVKWTKERGKVLCYGTWGGKKLGNTPIVMFLVDFFFFVPLVLKLTICIRFMMRATLYFGHNPSIAISTRLIEKILTPHIL